MSIPLKELLQKALKEADEFMKKQEYQKAASKYELASELMLQFAEHATTREVENERRQKARQFKELAKKLRSGEYIPPQKVYEKATPEKQAKDEADMLRERVMELVRAAKVTWDDIGGLEETKREIKFAIGMSVAQQPGNLIISPWTKILFYGPPGTGKTLLAAATSNTIITSSNSHATFFDVKISSILSKYFGESSKIVSELYGVARDMSPSVIFLDEFESITAKRDTTESGAERRILSTLLTELDGLEQKGRTDIYVLTIAATNRPWDLDPAVISRFEKHIYIPLPDAKARGQILKIHIEKYGYKSNVDYKWLVEITENFSGREIARLCKQAINKMIYEQNKDLPSYVTKGLDHAKQYKIKIRELTKDDFEYARNQIQPLTKPEEMKRYLEWKKYVEGG